VLLPLLVAIFLAFNPTFEVNTSFTWTKAVAAFFVVLDSAAYRDGAAGAVENDQIGLEPQQFLGYDAGDGARSDSVPRGTGHAGAVREG
jgi:hypothetical protein